MKEKLNKLDLTEKETWGNPNNISAIAERFGYEPDENFREALSTFLEQYVK